MKKLLAFTIVLVMVFAAFPATVSADGDTPNIAWQWNAVSGDCLCIDGLGFTPSQIDVWVRFDSSFDGLSGILPQTEGSVCIDPVASKIGVGSALSDFSFEVDRIYHVIFSDSNGGTIITVDDAFAGMVGARFAPHILCTMKGVTIDDLHISGVSSDNTPDQIHEDFQDGVFNCAGAGTDGAPVEDTMAPDHDHKWREAQVLTEASDGEPGLLQYMCSECHRYRYENYTVVTDTDAILGMLFTDGRGMISDEDFQRAAQSLVLIRRDDITFENGARYVQFDDPYSAVVVSLEEDEEITYENAAERIGLNPKYFRIGTVKTETSNGQRYCHISIAFNNAAYYTFSLHQKLAQIDELYLFATAAYYTGTCYPDNAGLMRGWRYYQLYSYYGTDDYNLDVNLDGSVNVKDLVYLKNFISDSVGIINIAAADADGDGAINLRDLAAYKRMLAGSE